MFFFPIFLIPAFVMADWTWSEKMSKLSKLTEFSLPGPSSDAMRCHSCTSMNASEIVDGSGVHPGVYLTSLLLSSIPVTSECTDPSETDELAPLCDQGICVKINYTARHSGRTDVLRACIPRSRGVFKEICTQFTSSAAHGTWCVCDDDMCNSAPQFKTSFSIKLLITFFMIAIYGYMV